MASVATVVITRALRVEVRAAGTGGMEDYAERVPFGEHIGADWWAPVGSDENASRDIARQTYLATFLLLIPQKQPYTDKGHS